jgi:hypothetical protein
MSSVQSKNYIELFYFTTNGSLHGILLCFLGPSLLSTHFVLMLHIVFYTTLILSSIGDNVMLDLWILKHTDSG